MARRIIHCCLDIEGGIRNAKDLKGCITVDGRTLMRLLFNVEARSRDIRDDKVARLAERMGAR